MEEKGHFINVLPDSGLVTFLAVVKERELRPRRSGGVYLHLLLGDRTGEIAGRVWDDAEEIARLFEADDVVKVRGTLERYNGKSQLIVQRIRRCQEEEFDESDFCPVSERDPDEMLTELRSHVERMHSEPLRSLLSRMLGAEDLVRALKVTPGAMRLHHAYRGGLKVMWTVLRELWLRLEAVSFRLRHFVSACACFSRNSASMRLRFSSK